LSVHITWSICEWRDLTWFARFSIQKVLQYIFLAIHYILYYTECYCVFLSVCWSSWFEEKNTKRKYTIIMEKNVLRFFWYLRLLTCCYALCVRLLFCVSRSHCVHGLFISNYYCIFSPVFAIRCTHHVMTVVLCVHNVTGTFEFGFVVWLVWSRCTYVY